MIRRWLAAHFESVDAPLVAASDDSILDYGVCFTFIWSW